MCGENLQFIHIEHEKIDFVIYSSFRSPAASYQTKHVTGDRP